MASSNRRLGERLGKSGSSGSGAPAGGLRPHRAHLPGPPRGAGVKQRGRAGGLMPVSTVVASTSDGLGLPSAKGKQLARARPEGGLARLGAPGAAKAERGVDLARMSGGERRRLAGRRIGDAGGRWMRRRDSGETPPLLTQNQPAVSPREGGREGERRVCRPLSLRVGGGGADAVRAASGGYGRKARSGGSRKPG
jgi:hypothetical protein